VVRAALRGVIPAVVGLGLVASVQMARPVLAESRRLGVPTLILSGLLLAASGVLAEELHPPVLAILCGAGGIAAVVELARSRVREPPRT
jgi:hypothetical protein